MRASRKLSEGQGDGATVRQVRPPSVETRVPPLPQCQATRSSTMSRPWRQCSALGDLVHDAPPSVVVRTSSSGPTVTPKASVWKPASDTA
jgi:hypothetical protein